MTLSIIIPVYNGLQNGLPKCLESIFVKQMLSKDLYEVICVDDCSTDNTREWLALQQKQYDNLRVLYNAENIRQGGARNRGMREAKGQYIAFLDQDDYYHTDALLQVYNHLKNNNLEILIVDCAYQTPHKESNTLQHNFPHREVMTGDEMIVRNSIPYAPWKFVFLRSLVIEHDLYFCENERIEDVDWAHVLTHYAKRVQYQPILFVHYNKTQTSTTMTSYCTPITTYSTLHLARRLYTLNETVFKECHEQVRECITRIGNQFFYIGLRNYMFMYDAPRTKAQQIQNMQPYTSPKWFVQTVAKYPMLYARASNMVSPILRLLLRLYRKIKYA